MLYAVVSDIHANLQAWYAVLDDMEDFGPEAILCLGDVVGYGPTPGEVLESVCEYVDEIVIGNHDAVVAGRYSSESFNDNARRVIDWTRDQLGDDVIGFFADLPADLDGDNFTIAHAELGDPERFDYVEDEEMARETLGSCDSDLVFVGHTHHAGIFVWDMAMDRVVRHDPTDFAALDDMRYIVNVGSVGDPRTDDLRASYCLYDSELREVFFRRVPFDMNEYRLDVEGSTLPMPPFCLTIGEDLDEYRSVVVERPTIVVTTEKRPRLRIAKGAVSAAASQEDPEAALALEHLEMQAEEERRKKRETLQKSLVKNLGASQKRHQETLARLKELHAKKRREAEARAEAERLEHEREEREREERAKEKKKELAQTVAARARESRERLEKRKQQEKERARKAIEQRKRAAEERRLREEEEKQRQEAEARAKKKALAEKMQLAEEKRKLEAEKRALEQENVKAVPVPLEKTVPVAPVPPEQEAPGEAELERRRIEEEKRKLEEEKRKLEEARKRLEEEKRLAEEKRRLEEEKRALEEEKRRIEEEKKRLAAEAAAHRPAEPAAQPAAPTAPEPPAPQLDKSKTAKLVLPKAPAAAATPTAVPAARAAAAPAAPAVPAKPVPAKRTVSETAQIDDVVEEESAPAPQAVDLLKEIDEETDPETAKQLRIKAIREAAEARETERKRKLAEKKAAREAQRAAAREAIRKKQEAARKRQEQAE